MAASYELAGMPPLRRSAAGLSSLAAIIIGQQVSVASARAIEARFAGEFPRLTAEDLTATNEYRFRAAGLSGPKIRTLCAIGEAMRSGSLDLDSLGQLDADTAHARLCAVKGIGPWTADIYLMISLGHADAFAAGDLALQEAMRHIDRSAARPNARQLLDRADIWRPWRAVGARMLWQHYQVIKARNGI